MKIIKNYLIPLVGALAMLSCSGNSGFKPRADANNCVSQSYEIYEGDTINRIDCNNKKQGKWVRHQGIAVRDTMWNQGDTIYFKDSNIISQR